MSMIDWEGCLPKQVMGPLLLMAKSIVYLGISIGLSFTLLQQAYNTKPTTSWVLVGGLTSSSVEFRIRQGGVRLVVFDDDEETNNNNSTIVFDQVLPTLDEDDEDSFLVVPVTVSGLEPLTRYQYRTMKTTTEEENIASGSFTTLGLPQTRFNFSFTTAGCAWTASKSSIFRRMQDKLQEQQEEGEPSFYIQLGDFHYEDIGSNNVQERIRAFDLTLGSPVQQEFLSQTPLVYMYDDHDWLGNDSGFNTSDSTLEEGSRESALLAYRLGIPHYPLALDNNDNNLTSASVDDRHAMAQSNQENAIYHAFTVGTVRFIVSDLRSETSGSNIYTDAQRDWLQNELAASESFDFIIWVTTKPWIGTPEVGEDNWLGNEMDRQELSDFITSRNITNLLAISSDAHMAAFDDGRNTYYGTSNDLSSIESFPILQSGPLDRLGSVKGGPFSEGCFTTRYERNSQYSLVRFIARDGENDPPCLELSSFRGNNLLFSKTLCGPSIASSIEGQGTGSCEIKRLSNVNLGLVAVAGVLTFVNSILIVVLLKGCCSKVVLILIVWIMILLTFFVGVGVPLARGIPQFNMFPFALLILLQSITTNIFISLWSRLHDYDTL